MSDENERSVASAGSQCDACRAAFERWAEQDGRLRTIKKTNGSYLDSPAHWAWEGWRAATLTDDEREAVKFFAEAGVYWATGEGVGHARRLIGMLRRLG